MRSLRSTVTLFLLACVFVAGTTSAQVSRLPNTGCPNAPFPQVVGQPALSQGFGVIAPPCQTPLGQPFIVLGTQSRPIPITPPLACVRGCTLDCTPLDFIPGGAWRALIPNDPRLVGACFCVQAGCIEAFPATGRCVMLSGALQVCITR